MVLEWEKPASKKSGRILVAPYALGITSLGDNFIDVCRGESKTGQL